MVDFWGVWWRGQMTSKLAEFFSGVFMIFVHKIKNDNKKLKKKWKNGTPLWTHTSHLTQFTFWFQKSLYEKWFSKYCRKKLFPPNFFLKKQWQTLKCLSKNENSRFDSGMFICVWYINTFKKWFSSLLVLEENKNGGQEFFRKYLGGEDFFQLKRRTKIFFFHQKIRRTKTYFLEKLSQNPVNFHWFLPKIKKKLTKQKI